MLRPRRSMRTVLVRATVASCAAILSTPSSAQLFDQVDLVTDNQAVNAAPVTDTSLKDAWGVSFSPSSPFWVSDRKTGVSTLYRVNPTTNVTTKVGLTVTIPGVGATGNPTGQAFNGSSQFVLGTGGPAIFLFTSLDGTVSGWNGGSAAQTLLPGTGQNSYTGATIATVGSSRLLFAANFGAGKLDVMDGATNTLVTNTTYAGKFVDPTLPAGYAPFDVKLLHGNLYVAYGPTSPTSPVGQPGAGHGVVDEFDTAGNLIQRIATAGSLDLPWGLEIAPASFGPLSGDLLVGNFGDGTIDAFDLAHNDAFAGVLDGLNGRPLDIPGLWTLTIGNDGGAGGSDPIYFTAGPHFGNDGLFGVLLAVPEPSTVVLAAAFLAVGAWFIGLPAVRRARLARITMRRR